MAGLIGFRTVSCDRQVPAQAWRRSLAASGKCPQGPAGGQPACRACLPLIGALTIIGWLWRCIFHDRRGSRLAIARRGIGAVVAASIDVAHGFAAVFRRAECRHCRFCVVGGLARNRAGAGVCGLGAGVFGVLSESRLACFEPGRNHHPDAAADRVVTYTRQCARGAVSSLLDEVATGAGALERLAEPFADWFTRTRSGSGSVFERRGAPASGATVNGLASWRSSSRQAIGNFDSR